MSFKFKKPTGLGVRVIGQQVNKAPIRSEKNKSEDKPAFNFKGSSTDNVKK